MKREMMNEEKIASVLQRLKVLASDASTSSSDILHNILTKDVATVDIQESLLNAKQLGLIQLDSFVSVRLITSDNGKSKAKLTDPLKKSKAAIFSTLYEILSRHSRIKYPL